MQQRCWRLSVLLLTGSVEGIKNLVGVLRQTEAQPAPYYEA